MVKPVARTAPRRASAVRERIAAGAVVGVAALAVLADLLQAITFATPWTVPIAATANPRLALAPLPQLFASDVHAGILEAGDAGWSTRLLYVGPSLLHAAVVVVATILLLRIMHAIAAREPFSARTVRAWPQLAAALLCGGVAQLIVDTVANDRLTAWATLTYGADRSAPGAPGTTLSEGMAAVGANVPTVVVGLLALALTAAFHAGAKLAEDADGLV
ncbi:DUF2975 domain-containing protein [Sanguibacter antarcticus]|uniref:DUF2975 family protein n=1 Tax=Sanguibacter antarcticus TaxID=372484 RepID=A0A2A9E7U4_9MICO|nr:DUF2975 domain-containing protein [Sanguibacter antarcticus]PFG34240.1 Protein of unknown function (DUF2975) [Sanguibacter antarcticus]